MTDTNHMTPQQAAKRAGCGRTTIMRALERQELRATRGNDGRWQITPDALSDWLSMRPVRSDDGHSPDMSKPVMTDTPETLARLVAAETRVELLAAQLTDIRADRDAWRSQAERLSEAQAAAGIGIIARLEQIFRRKG